MSYIDEEELEEQEQEQDLSDDKVSKKKSKKSKLPYLVENRILSLDDVFIESGQIGLDLATTNGAGIPLGGFITMWGPPSFGKSTIFGDCTRRILTKYKNLDIPFKAMYIDIEGSKNLFKSLGLQEFIDDGRLIYSGNQTVTYDRLGEVYDSILDPKNEAYDYMKDVKIIIIDSICNVTTVSKEEGNIEKADYGIIAKAAKEFYRRYTPKTQGKIATFLINQVAGNQDQGFNVPKFKQASSEASLHYPHIIIHAQKKINDSDIKESSVKSISDISKKDNKATEKKGYVVTLSTFNEAKKLKNRFGQIKDVDILLYRGQGVVNAKTLKDILISYGFAVPNGNNTSYTLQPELTIERNSDVYKTKELNAWVRSNTVKIIEFLKSVGMYKATLDFKASELLAFLETHERFKAKLGYNGEEDFDGFGGV